MACKFHFIFKRLQFDLKLSRKYSHQSLLKIKRLFQNKTKIIFFYFNYYLSIQYQVKIEAYLLRFFRLVKKDNSRDFSKKELLT